MAAVRNDTMLLKIESNLRPDTGPGRTGPKSRDTALSSDFRPRRAPLASCRTRARKEPDMRIFVAMLVALAVVGTAGAQTEEGTANFYGDKFQGKKTANGDVFDKNGLTAAHKKLPFGTKVKVTNVENGKSVVVTVNDRMAANNPAVIDVTRRAAEELDFAKADPQRFAALYERNFDRVYAFVARRSGSRGEAEDLTAEVFHQALANLGRFEWRGAPFAAWLLQIARNAVSDRWQRLARERGEPAPDSGAGSKPADADRRAVLADLVTRLPGDQQRVVLARFVEQRSIREIAEALGRTEGAVKQLQLRALQSLRAGMRDAHE